MEPEVLPEHEWLRQLMGEWTYEASAPVQPGGVSEPFAGVESVRALGDIWVVAEGRGPHPAGGEAETLMTLGYDAVRGRFVGTWVGSPMAYLWIYEGTLDDSQRVLTLECDGPAMNGEGGTLRYHDVIELVSADHRTLTARVEDGNGGWTELMKVDYRRRR